MKLEPVGTFLTGGFPPLFCTMNQQTVESMVTHLVQCSCNGFVDYPKGIEKVPLEAKDRPFKQITSNGEDQSRTSMKWSSILNDLLSRCPQFCRDELALPKPANTARWRERNSRKVLAPLGLKQNTENIIAGSLDMSRKRKADTNIWTPTKHVKVDDSLKPCSVVIKRASAKALLLQYKCISNRSFVKLYDIVKEIPQVKEEVKPIFQNAFMGFLGLDSKETSCNKQCPEIKTSNPVKLVSHPHIPFSSDYGRRLLARERHYLPQEVALRKIERTEWYLKGTAALTRKNQQPEIRYNTRSKYTHTYNFPKRQYHQNHSSLQQAFNKYLCKPVCIHLEIMDLSCIVAKMKNMQQEVSSTVVVINDSDDDDDVFLSKTELPQVQKEVVTIDCATLSEESEVIVQPQSNLVLHTEKFKKPNLFPKPRRSLRLNVTKSLS